MPLPVGTWNVNVGGQSGTLVIGTSGGTSFNGTILGQPLTGFFDEAEQEFRFMRVTTPDVSTFEVYTGTLFTFSPSTNTSVSTLAGTFMAFPAGGPGKGWSAQMTQKLKEGKDSKDGKDKEQSKDTKDGKDHKDSIKDHDKHPKDKELEVIHPSSGGGDPLLAQLALRVSAMEQQLAVGKSFITPDERPAVGTQASGDKPSG